MTLLVDAASLVTPADRRDPLRHAVREVLEAERGALVIAAPVTAEADYLLRQRIGQPARLPFCLQPLAQGVAEGSQFLAEGGAVLRRDGRLPEHGAGDVRADPCLPPGQRLLNEALTRLRRPPPSVLAGPYLRQPRNPAHSGPRPTLDPQKTFHGDQ